MSHFDERSGVVYCSTSWGQWGQTIEEVFIEVDVVEGTRPRDIQCELKPKSLSVTVSKKEILKVCVHIGKQSEPMYLCQCMCVCVTALYVLQC